MRLAILSFHSHSDRSFLDDRDLAVLSGELRAEGVENDLVVTVLDEQRSITAGEPNGEIVARLIELLRAYDVVAFQRVWRLGLISELRAALPGIPFVYCEGEHPLADVPADYVCTNPIADALAGFARARKQGGADSLPSGVSRPGSSQKRVLRSLSKRRPFAPNLSPVFVNRDALPSFRSFTVLGNEGCPYQADARQNPLYAGVSMPEGAGRGCAFCAAGNNYARLPDVVSSVFTELAFLVRHPNGPRHFVLKDQNPFAYLDDVLARCDSEGLSDFTLLLETRADWFVKHEARFRRALSTAQRAKVTIAPYLVGIENFSQTELDRFNKGIRAEQNEAFLSALRAWKAEYGAALDLSHASFGFVLFTPWTTLEDLERNRDAIRRTRFHELRGKLLLSRARLYADNALYYLAQRDGLHAQRFESALEDNSVRFGYLPATPWRFQNDDVARFSALATELSEERGGRDELALFDALLAAFRENAAERVTAESVRARLGSALLRGSAAQERPKSGARTARVFTNLRCNQACLYCTSRSPTDDPKAVARSAVAREMERAKADGAEELVLTGGEPALRRDLVELVSLGKRLGFERVVLETNATVIDDALAVRLSQAGLSLARVNLSRWGDELDELTRDAGGFRATLRGAHALVAASVPIEFAAVVVRSTLAALASLPTEIVREFPSARRLVLAVPSESPDANQLASFAESAAAILSLTAACRATGLALTLDPGSSVPPCLFRANERPPGLFALSPGGARRAEHVKSSECTECLVHDRCAGFRRSSLERFGAPELYPIREERARRRLTLAIGVDEQVRRELVTESLYRAEDGTQTMEAIVRVNFNCNQSCAFCFVSTHLPGAEHAAILRELDAAATRGARIVLSGGEPTLNPRLPEYVAYARSRSSLPVEIQTNAVRLENPALASSLRDAGLARAFVSLHGSSAAVSDAVTSSAGTFERTLRGIEQLIAHGVSVVLNFVICQNNVDDFPSYVRFVAARFPGTLVNVSFVAASSDLVPRDAALVPRYERALPALAEGLAEAERLSLRVTGFESMCGLPLCLVPASLERYFGFGEVPDGFDDGEFLKPDACRSCALERRCFGLRRGYAELYGATELRPVSEAGARAS